MFFATTSARATAEDAEAPSVDSLLTFNMPSRNRTKGLEVWPESHSAGFALSLADVLQPYSA